MPISVSLRNADLKAKIRSLTSCINKAPAESVTYTQCAPASSIILACLDKDSGSFIWAIIKNPATSSPNLRAAPMC